MMDKRYKELCDIIHGFDDLLGYWFEGVPAGIASCDMLAECGKSVYEQADALRNRAFELIEELARQ